MASSSSKAADGGDLERRDVHVVARMRPFIEGETGQYMGSPEAEGPEGSTFVVREERVSVTGRASVAVSKFALDGAYGPSRLPGMKRTGSGRPLTVFGRSKTHEFKKEVKGPPPEAPERPTAQERATEAELDLDRERDLYATHVERLVRNAADGGVSVLFAYGQTGSGKTYSITSMTAAAVEDLFSRLEKRDLLSIEVVEILGSSVSDLLGGRAPVSILEDTVGVIHLRGTQAVEASSAAQALSVIQSALADRATKATARNATSSRSHAVVRLAITPRVKEETEKSETERESQDSDSTPQAMATAPTQAGTQTQTQTTTTTAAPRAEGNAKGKGKGLKGKPVSSRLLGFLPVAKSLCEVAGSKTGELFIIDLAGSERNKDSQGHDAKTLEETKAINTSLMTLKECIRARTLAEANTK